MRMRVVGPAALMLLMPVLAEAAGRPASEICVNAGYRVGSASFDMCVARVSGDDPLAALEGGELSGRSEGTAKPPAETDPLGAIQPAKPLLPGLSPHLPTAREELPPSFNSPTVVGGVPQAPPSVPPSQGGWGPTSPTAPTWPVVTPPNLPGWNFGSQ